MAYKGGHGNHFTARGQAGSWADFDCTGTKFYHWGALTGLISHRRQCHLTEKDSNDHNITVYIPKEWRSETANGSVE
jgi:hypothetical protein